MFIPDGQNYSCRRCGLLCRRLFIPVSPEERDRIQKLVGEDEGGLFLERQGQIYLARSEDGRCLFLREDNLCDLHGRFGEASKPLACRLFPFTVSLRGNEIAVGVRFQCPAVAANEGVPLARHRKGLGRLVREVSAKTEALQGADQGLWKGLSWDVVLRLIQFFDDLLLLDGVPLPVKVVCAMRLLSVLDLADGEEIQGKETLDKMVILRDAVLREEGDRHEANQKLTKAERSAFYQLVAQYARRDEEDPHSWSLGARLRRSRATTRIMLGKGKLSEMSQDLPDVPLSSLSSSMTKNAEAEEPCLRFLRMKLETGQFFGSAHHGFDWSEGLTSLWMAYPVMGTMARLFAAAGGAAKVTREDACEAIAAVDHGFSHMAAFRSRSVRSTVRRLAKEETFRKLCQMYGL